MTRCLRVYVVRGMSLAVLACLPAVSGAQTTNQSLVVVDTIAQSATATASGTNSTALGIGSTASGDYSLAEGILTTASGSGSHAEGSQTQATNLHSHAEGYQTVAGGAQSHAEGEGTVAGAKNSHAGGAYARVLPEHTNAFIHATGSGTNSYKETAYRDTAHFDRLATLSAANDWSNSVLSRWETDQRYATATQGSMAQTALQPTSRVDYAALTNIPENVAQAVSTNDADARYLNAAGDKVTGTIEFDRDGAQSRRIYFRTSTNEPVTQYSPSLFGWGTNLYIGQYYYSWRIWHDGIDGSGSGMDADLLDGLNSSAYAQLSGAVVSNYLFGGDGRFNGDTKTNFFDSYVDGSSAYHYAPAAMMSRGSTNSQLHQTQAALVLYNDRGGSNRWAKLAFAAREGDGSGNAVSVAGIAGQMKNTLPGYWAVGDLILWTKNNAWEDERMRIKGATGYVGIGTNEPVSMLDVAGAIRGTKISLGSTQNVYTLNLGTALSNTKIALHDDGSDPYGMGIQAYQMRLHLGGSAARFSFLSSAAGSELFTIKGTGNVGVGTNTPSAKLDVAGDARFASGVRFPAQGDISMGSYTNGAY